VNSKCNAISITYLLFVLLLPLVWYWYW